MDCGLPLGSLKLRRRDFGCHEVSDGCPLGILSNVVIEGFGGGSEKKANRERTSPFNGTEIVLSINRVEELGHIKRKIKIKTFCFLDLL